MCRSSRVAVLLLLALSGAGCVTTGEPREAAREEAAAPAQPTIDPAQREALKMVVEVMRAGEWATARGLAEELTINYPQMAEAHANQGNILYHLQQGERAEQAWRKALELRPDWAALCNRMGLFFREQGRFEEALAMYRQALAADEGYAPAHRNIAILYEIYLGQGEEALTHYQRYQELHAAGGEEVALWIADLERRVKGGRP